jgi:hypothetical protein
MMDDNKRKNLRRRPRRNLDGGPIGLALRAADARAPDIPDDRGYRAAHPRFRAFFAAHVEPFITGEATEDELGAAAFLGASLVYSWMPTILRGVCPEALNASAARLRILPGLTDAAGFADLLDGMDADGDELLDLLTFINGSIVGTSKFLHFLNPAAAPIWDRRVAMNFGVSEKGQIENLRRYRQYVRLVAEANQGPDYPSYRALLGQPGAPANLDARAIEYALFINGGPDPEEQASL